MISFAILTIQNSKAAITESDLLELSSLIEDALKPDFSQHKLRLIIDSEWNNNTTNASMRQIGNKVVVSIYGGMAREHYLDKDSVAVILCHEIAHIIRGPSSADSGTISLIEGEADYQSINYCFKKLFNSDDNASVIRGKNIPNVVKNRCKNSYPLLGDLNQKNLCIRATLAAIKVSLTLAELTQSPFPDISTPSTSVADQTIKGHYSVQCRLDNFFHAALNLPRPTCWYKEI